MHQMGRYQWQPAVQPRMQCKVLSPACGRTARRTRPRPRPPQLRRCPRRRGWRWRPPPSCRPRCRLRSAAQQQSSHGAARAMTRFAAVVQVAVQSVLHTQIFVLDGDWSWDPGDPEVQGPVRLLVIILAAETPTTGESTPARLMAAGAASVCSNSSWRAVEYQCLAAESASHNGISTHRRGSRRPPV